MNYLYNYFLNQFNNKKIVQSYIIGNTSLDLIAEEIKKILSDFFFMNSINLENSDIYIVKPENNNISKEKIKNLINDLNTTSQFSNLKVYIIDECEKLNDYSCNSLLKILEEPQENVYAFLITKNMESIKQTIISRCQKIFISSDYENSNFEENIVKIGNYLINSIEKNKIKCISENYDLYNMIENKNDLQEILKYVLYKYDDHLNNIVNNIEKNDIIKNEDINKISNIILIINENINKLDGNLNKNLSIDRFIIEMWRCINENS